MKLVQMLAVAAALAAPLASFAQAHAPVTRESVRAELIELQQAGYDPSSDQTQYPANIQAAETRLHAHDSVAASSYGMAVEGMSESGSPMQSAQIAAMGGDYTHP